QRTRGSAVGVRAASCSKVAARLEGFARPRPPGWSVAVPPRATARRTHRGAEARRPTGTEGKVDVERGVVDGLPVVSLQLGPDHELGRDLEQKPRRDGDLAHPPRRPPPRVREVEAPLRAGDPD